MATDGSLGSGHVQNVVPDMEALQTRLQAQEAALRALEQHVDYRFRRLDGRFDDVIEQIRALGINANGNGIGGRPRPREEQAQGGPVIRPVAGNNGGQPPYDDEDTEEEEDLVLNDGRNRPARRAGGRGYGRNNYNNNNGYDYGETSEFKLKVDIPSFNGNLNIEDFIDWIAEIDRFFEYMEIPQDKRVRLVACRLKGGASAWWERLQNRRYREGKQPIRTWFRMKQMLQRDFLPPDYEQILFQQYQQCCQGQKSVHEYTAEFMRLAERNDLRESEGQQVARYVDGLKLQIRDKIGVQVLRNLNEAKNMAIKAELMLHEHESFIKQKSNRFDSTKQRGYGNDNYSRSVQTDKAKSVQEQQKNNDLKEDNSVGKRPAAPKEIQKPNNPYARPIIGKCYRCNQPGHRSNECPNRRGVNMVEREDDEEICCEPDGDDDEEEYERHEEGDEQNYVIRKLMLTPKQDDSTQRHQLFRTRCTINGRVFDLIVDSGSCENIIGKEAVEALQLPMEKHPSPYSIGWIKVAEKI